MKLASPLVHVLILNVASYRLSGTLIDLSRENETGQPARVKRDPAFCSFLNRNRDFESVSPAWHSQYITRAMRISLHLLTQVANMCSDQAALSNFIVSPHAAADDARRQNLSCMRNQQMEQAALGGSHFHFALISKDFMA